MNRRNIVLPVIAAGSAAVLAAVGIASALAPSRTTAPSAVVTTTQEPNVTPAHLAPRCFETSTAGAQDCAWVPVAQCLTDEDGDDAIPASYDGCYWDANTQGNRTGTSYVIWRGGRG